MLRFAAFIYFKIVINLILFSNSNKCNKIAKSNKKQPKDMLFLKT